MSQDDAQGAENTVDHPPLSPIKPYLIRAWHEWCTDQGFTPHLIVQMSWDVEAPKEYAVDDQLVLNVSYDATNGLSMDNNAICFSARFGGRAREVVIPVRQVLAIYARENGQGMEFEPPVESEAPWGAESSDDSETPLRQAVESTPQLGQQACPDEPDNGSPKPVSKGLRRVK